eukprot:SAG31_NODE_4988_length_2818_cov_9.534020_2_plen_165_part_00
MQEQHCSPKANIIVLHRPSGKLHKRLAQHMLIRTTSRRKKKTVAHLIAESHETNCHNVVRVHNQVVRLPLENHHVACCSDYPHCQLAKVEPTKSGLVGLSMRWWQHCLHCTICFHCMGLDLTNACELVPASPGMSMTMETRPRAASSDCLLDPMPSARTAAQRL